MDTILPLKVAVRLFLEILFNWCFWLQYGVNTSKLLKTFLDNHEFKTYKIQHECSDRELHDVKAFVERVIGHWNCEVYENGKKKAPCDYPWRINCSDQRRVVSLTEFIDIIIYHSMSCSHGSDLILFVMIQIFQQLFFSQKKLTRHSCLFTATTELRAIIVSSPQVVKI